MKRVLIVVVALGLGWLVVSLISIHQTLTANKRDRIVLLQALREQFPATEFQGSESYEKRFVYVIAYGVTDRAKRDEIRDRVEALKIEWEVKADVRLEFWDTRTSGESATFEF